MGFPLSTASLLAALFLGTLAGNTLAPSVQAQTPPDGDALLDAWRAQQGTRLRAAEGLAFDLVLTRRVEGPMGLHRLRSEAEVRVRLDADVATDAPRFETSVRTLEVNGAAADPDRYEGEVHPLRRLLGPHTSWVERPLTLPYPLLRSARSEQVTAEVREGRALWRLVLRDLPPGVVEATVWFARESATRGTSPRLVRSEVRLRLDGRPPPRARPGLGDRPPPRRPSRRGSPPDLRARLTVTTDYAPTRGLDLPTSQTLDLVAQQRRRIRTFTVLVEQQLELRDVRVIE